MNKIIKVGFKLGLLALVCESSAIAGSLPLDTDFWSLAPAEYYSGEEYGVPRTGPVQTNSSQGLHFLGSGYRAKTRVYSDIKIDFSTGGDIYFSWKAAGGDGVFWGEICADCYTKINVGFGWVDGSGYSPIAGASTFTTNHSFDGSYHVLPDVWYFTHFVINDDHSFTVATSTENYDDQGGNVFLSNDGYINDDNWAHISEIQLNAALIDSYGAGEASVVLGEAKYISDRVNNTAIIASSLDIHIPVVEYQTSLQSFFYSVNFEYMGLDSDNSMLWELQDYTAIDNQLEGAIPADLYGISDHFMRIYSSQRGDFQGWLDLEFIGTHGDNNRLAWKMRSFGLNALPSDLESWNLLVGKARVGDILLLNTETPCTDDKCPPEGTIFGKEAYGFYSHAALISSIDKVNKEIEVFHARGSQFAKPEQVRKDWFNLDKLRKHYEGGTVSLFRVNSVVDEAAEDIVEAAVVKYNNFSYVDIKGHQDDFNNTYNSALINNAYTDFSVPLDDGDESSDGDDYSAFLLTPDELSISNALENIFEWKPTKNPGEGSFK